MYSGPGPGPMMATATAWDALADGLYSTATGYGFVVSELSGRGWLGPSSLAMAEVAEPFVTWLYRTAGQAAETASRARAAAAAYELAFAMTVPPQEIAANRSLLTVLAATNFFGQNAPAIAATEAHYCGMWLQDAIAMYGYAGSSAAATRLTPYTQPPRTLDAAGPAANAGAVAQAIAHVAGTHHAALSQLPSTAAQALHRLGDTAGASTSPPPFVEILEHVPNVTNSVLSSANAVTSGRNIYITNVRLALQAGPQEPEPVREFWSLPASDAAARPAGPAAPMSARMGRAIAVGRLAVPSSWAVTAPEIQPLAPAVPDFGMGTASPPPTEAGAAPGSVFSQSVLGTLSRNGTSTPQHKSKPIIVRSPAAG